MVTIDGDSLTIKDVVEVSREYMSVQLSPKVLPRIEQSRKYVERILKENKPVYGITTGFGELSTTFISPDDSGRLQENLIRSHSVGVGDPLSEDVVRAMILLRANALAKGYSGVRQGLIQFLIDLLNKKIFPYIPSQGSVGASGDLAPLSHLALVILGEGECVKKGKRYPSLTILKEKRLKPLRLLAKEGLGLTNGTQMMGAIGSLVAEDADLLLKNAQIAGSMSLEALKGTARAFDKKIHALRPHPGQIQVAANIRKLIRGSKIIASHIDCDKVQDAYTLRCMPQVLGAIKDTISRAKDVLAVEINSVTDNPLVFAEEEEVISGGNFHGEPLAFIMDFMGIGLAEIASISERTIDRLVNPHVSGLPPFLSANSGLNSGFMIAQYTAAALVSENKVLAHPSSVDSIPTSAGQEDHVSMGSISARNTAQIARNVQHVLAIEMLCAAQGIDFLSYTPGAGTKIAHQIIREHVTHMTNDRILYKDMEIIHQLILSGIIVEEVEKRVGKLL